jgi:hypothetical protein
MTHLNSRGSVFGVFLGILKFGPVHFTCTSACIVQRVVHMKCTLQLRSDPQLVRQGVPSTGARRGPFVPFRPSDEEAKEQSNDANDEERSRSVFTRK